MPLQDDVQLISVDDHVIEPANVGLDRLPRRFREVAPQIRRNEIGHGIWHSDSNWPNSRKMLMRSLANLSDGDARKIAEDNARRVFNFTGGR